MPDGPVGATAPAAPATAPPPAGLQAQARLRVLLARKVLESVVPILGSGSDDGRKVLNAVKALADFSGDTAGGLTQAEHQAMGQAIQPVPRPGPGAPPPAGPALRPPVPGPGSMGPAGAGGAPGPGMAA